MPTIGVKNANNETVGEIALSDAVFGAEVSASLLHEIVLMQQASRRQGTASTKTRGFVSGGGKKPWKQKGTGRARAGSSRSPLWRGGAVVFGPLPRDYAYSVPKKKARAALFSALSSKVQEGKVVVLDALAFPETKTKHMAALLSGLQLSGTVLVVTPESDEAIARVSRNLPNARVLEVSRLNVYDLLSAESLLMTRAGAEAITAYWGGRVGSA